MSYQALAAELSIGDRHLPEIATPSFAHHTAVWPILTILPRPPGGGERREQARKCHHRWTTSCRKYMRVDRLARGALTLDSGIKVMSQRSVGGPAPSPAAARSGRPPVRARSQPGAPPAAAAGPAPRAGGSACCYWNGYGTSVTTQLTGCSSFTTSAKKRRAAWLASTAGQSQDRMKETSMRSMDSRPSSACDVSTAGRARVSGWSLRPRHSSLLAPRPSLQERGARGEKNESLIAPRSLFRREALEERGARREALGARSEERGARREEGGKRR